MPLRRIYKGSIRTVEGKRKVAVAGVGQIENKSRHTMSMVSMYRITAQRALEDAGVSAKDVQAVIFGNAPEYFEGVNHPEKWIGEFVSGSDKPLFRVHTGGTVGGAAAICAYHLVASGLYDVVLAISGNKLSECAHTQLGLSTVYDPITIRYLAAGAIGAVAVQSREYMNATGCKEEHAAWVAVKNRQNAMKNPYAHLKIPNYNFDIAMNSPYLSPPLKLSDTCPQSDGCCAMVFVSKERLKYLKAKPGWVLSAASVTEGVNYAGRSFAKPIALRKAAELAYERAGIKPEDLDVVEVYDAFSYQEMIWYEGLKLCDWGEGWKLIESKRTFPDGDIPVNMSGGVLSANSIGAAAMARKAEAYLQVTGKAGERQVKGAKIALGHGWGGAIQFHTIMIISKDEP